MENKKAERVFDVSSVENCEKDIKSYNIEENEKYFKSQATAGQIGYYTMIIAQHKPKLLKVLIKEIDSEIEKDVLEDLNKQLKVSELQQKMKIVLENASLSKLSDIENKFKKQYNPAFEVAVKGQAKHYMELKENERVAKEAEKLNEKS